jgi:phosphoribosylanthranilate isomerase
MKLKICGMKLNTAEVSQLQPDYLGFIFYDNSPRFFDLEEMPQLSSAIKKVGVFVNAEIGDILAKIDQFNLKIIQLHGTESAEFCAALNAQLGSKNLEILRAEAVKVPRTEPVEVRRAEPVEVWKVFSIKDAFDFSVLEAYEPVVDKFLFDTKGKEKGGNGYAFDWSVLKEYPSKKPFILSGGIGQKEIEKLRELSKTDLPLYGIDVNSKFEIEPGLKDVEKLRKFKKDLFEVLN